MIAEETGAGRPDCLVAMVSRDIIVLAKLIRGLRPRQARLFRTAHARSQEWGEAAPRLLAGLRDEGGLLGDYQVVDLPEGDLPARLEAYRVSLARALPADLATGLVAYDCTGGQNIFHVLGFGWVRQWAAPRGLTVAAVYCDADTGSLLVLPGDPSGQPVARPIRFRYREGRELAQRFAMYGVTCESGERLWPPAVAAPALDALYEALCADARLRALFHSQWQFIKRWQARQPRAAAAPPGALWARVRERLKESVDTLPLPAAGRSLVERRAVELVGDWVVRPEDNGAWLERHAADPFHKDLNQRLQSLAAVLPSLLAPGKRRGLERQDLQQNLLPGLFKALVGNLRLELEQHSRNRGEDPMLVPPEEKQAAMSEALDALRLPAEVAGRVRAALWEPQGLPLLFETCVARAVARRAATRAGLAAVYRNVALRQGARGVCEWDALVLMENGDIAVAEAKSHFSSAETKKIESNIKQLRDFGGAYSSYRLVYPLTAAELAALAGESDAGLADFKGLGMDDAAAWRQHVREVSRSRDQRILGLDELERLLEVKSPGAAPG